MTTQGLQSVTKQAERDLENFNQSAVGMKISGMGTKDTGRRIDPGAAATGGGMGMDMGVIDAEDLQSFRCVSASYVQSVDRLWDDTNGQA